MIRILAVGRLKNTSVAALADDYLKRIRPWANIEIREVKDQDPDREAQAMLGRIGAGELVVALDERGESLTSRGLAALLAGHGSPTFVIGGPDGLGAALRDRADRTVALSAMTLPHELARLLLVEQIYRGLAINRGHAYHRD